MEQSHKYGEIILHIDWPSDEVQEGCLWMGNIDPLLEEALADVLSDFGVRIDRFNDISYIPGGERKPKND